MGTYSRLGAIYQIKTVHTVQRFVRYVIFESRLKGWSTYRKENELASPIDGGLFSFVLNLIVSTALINLAASLEILSVSLHFSKQFQLPQFLLS